MSDRWGGLRGRVEMGRDIDPRTVAELLAERDALAERVERLREGLRWYAIGSGYEISHGECARHALRADDEAADR
jgi:hypothetical protein